ncbi:hypothetical protein BJX96DRAFT_10019 [Aspergillus floccosus]
MLGDKRRVRFFRDYVSRESRTNGRASVSLDEGGSTRRCSSLDYRTADAAAMMQEAATMSGAILQHRLKLQQGRKFAEVFFHPWMRRRPSNNDVERSRDVPYRGWLAPAERLHRAASVSLFVLFWISHGIGLLRRAQGIRPQTIRITVAKWRRGEAPIWVLDHGGLGGPLALKRRMLAIQADRPSPGNDRGRE